MNDRPLTIAVDFDGVIADYDGWKGNQTFGSPRSDVIEALQVLRSEGWKIVIYSTRGVEEIKPSLNRCVPAKPSHSVAYTITAADDQGHTVTQSINVNVR